MNSENIAGFPATSSARTALTFDYMSVAAIDRFAVEYVDYYESLGWKVVKNEKNITHHILTFKRDRRINNKSQLTRLQVELEDNLNGIRLVEKKKRRKMFSIVTALGIIASLFFGTGMCLCMPDVFQSEPYIWMYILGGLLSFVGCLWGLVGYLSYKRLSTNNSLEMNQLIDQKRDKIADICENARKLLG